MSTTPISISNAEWQVMQAIWSGHPVGAAEVIERLAGSDASASWHPKTVSTLLGRLVQKGALDYRQDGKRRYLYSPAVSRDECVRRESASFVERVFGGETAPAVVCMIEEGELTSEDVDRLQALLESKRPKEKRGRGAGAGRAGSRRRPRKGAGGGPDRGDAS